jgi:rhodanese-related sulfurtransferase
MSAVKEIDAAQLAAWMEEEPESFRLVDVRTVNEMARGMLSGAEALPMHLIPLRADEFTKGDRVVFYCQTGARSGQVCAFLQQQGIPDVFNLRGGIVDWSRNGYAVQTPRLSSVAV